MKPVSQEEVKLAVDSINDNQESLNIGELKGKVDNLESIILILKECWNTKGGNEKQTKLKELVDQELDFSKVEGTINNIKSTTISYTTISKQRILNYGDNLPNLHSIN